MTILRVAVPVPLPGLFDYLPESGAPLPPAGSRVLVPFGRRRLVGVVMEHADTTGLDPGSLKAVEQILDPGLLDAPTRQLATWCARYYCHPVGETVALALPGALRHARGFQARGPTWYRLTAAGDQADLNRAPRQDEIRRQLETGPCTRGRLAEIHSGTPAALRRMLETGLVEEIEPPPEPARTIEPGPTLNARQRQAAAAILTARDRFQALLLAGVTGSGKTEVYLRAARAMLRRGRQVLVLLPEIGLTPQIVRRFEARLGQPAWTYHSGLSESERLATWKGAAAGTARLLVGTRSAVFLPLARPGLVVVDEEHDSSFKQQEGPRYSGRDVAVKRAQLLDIPVVLGTATPSLESLHNARNGRYRLLELPRRAGEARMASWQTVDIRGEKKRPAGLGRRCLEAIDQHLSDGGQVLVFRNRRGYAPVLLCTACGWQADCHRCSAHLTWHQRENGLICHHCGYRQAVPAACPSCGDPGLRGLGAGTERLEEHLAETFDRFPVYRVDRDSMGARDRFENLLEKIRGGDPCILVGTQMIAKGHHLPGVTLVVVTDVDQALFSADFRAPERLGQLLVQVSGRAGRGEQPGHFMVQTLHPEHEWLRMLSQGDYTRYAESLLAERLEARLPPQSALAMLRAESRQEARLGQFLKRAVACARPPETVELAGPFPAVMARRAGFLRQQVWAQAESRARLTAFLNDWQAGIRDLPEARYCRWHLDVDPVDL